MNRRHSRIATLGVAALFLAGVAAPASAVESASSSATTQTAAAQSQSQGWASSFSQAQVRETSQGRLVTFTDSGTGENYAFLFAADGEVSDVSGSRSNGLNAAAPAVSHNGGATVQSMLTADGYYLNRAETKQLITEGKQWAFAYAVAAALGIGQAAIGALIENNWHEVAQTAYSHGNCVRIAPNTRAYEVHHGVKNCK